MSAPREMQQFSDTPGSNGRAAMYRSDYYYGEAQRQAEDTFIPLGMTLFIRQKGKNVLALTRGFRTTWMGLTIFLFGTQFFMNERVMLFFRFHFWILLFSMVYFIFGFIHVLGKCLDKSIVTRILQMSYVIAMTFSTGTSLYYVLLLFADDLNRKNPREDNIYINFADGYPLEKYLRTSSLDDPLCEIEFKNTKNIARTMVHFNHYVWTWLMHILCHVVIPVVLVTPLYFENTRIFYTDLIGSGVVMLLYTGWLWLGTRVIYNPGNKPCLDSDQFVCDPEKVNPEYRMIYKKLSFLDGETVPFVLLLWLFVFMAFYVARAISKRYARSAAMHYTLGVGVTQAAAVDLAGIKSIPDEQSGSGSGESNRLPNPQSGLSRQESQEDPDQGISRRRSVREEEDPSRSARIRGDLYSTTYV